MHSSHHKLPITNGTQYQPLITKSLSTQHQSNTIMTTYFYPTNNSNYSINNIQKQSNNSQTCLTLLRNNNNNTNNVGSSSSSTSSESFKLVEKVQPKKSRTKYTKEQVNLIYL